jgi:hypothetical protein
MEESTVSFRQLAATSKHFARRLVTIGENRLELLAVEVQEERERHPARHPAGARRGGVRPARRTDAHGGHRGFAVGLVTRGRPPDFDGALRRRRDFSLPAAHRICCATGRRFPPRWINSERTANVWKKSSHEPARLAEKTFDRRKRTQPRAVWFRNSPKTLPV